MLNLRRWKANVALWIGFISTLSAVILFQPIQPALSQTSPVSSSRSSEIRGVWLTNVDSDVLFSRVRLEGAIEKLAELNFNTIYPTVWNWGYTVYPSEVAKQTFGVMVDPRVPELAIRDTLADTITLGHQHGFTVIPWFEFGFMTTAESEIAALYPDWVTQRRDGTKTWQDTIYQRLWLNPFKPEVQRFILDLILEIVTNYDVDGIQFDDHLGLPDEFGYDDYTVQLYKQEHQGQAPPANSQDPTWVRWRADKITAFMQRVFQEVKAKKSNILISVSPNNYIFAYNHFLQDWRLWQQRGYVEELIVQLYRDSLYAFETEMKRPEVQDAKEHILTAIGVLAGLKDKSVSIQQVLEQVQSVRREGFPGVSFFFYETLWNLSEESEGDRQAVFQTLFDSPASRPDLYRVRE
ncbi:MAG: family 10 glycosylhydrolase [Cyanobacteria bacterium CRU_2_1]|nr:family 10 glycosylhydrolase [Cyanobacteria bacterium RU_5_0]NJR57529.1 family 10 glycosylhydrolase [Cyanobacteria bacterium CRU_2_1]